MVNIKDYLNSFFASLLSDTIQLFLIKFDKIIKESYIIHPVDKLDNYMFQYMINKITSNNVERGELCSSSLKKVKRLLIC